MKNFEDLKAQRKELENSFLYSKAAINNFMNNSHNAHEINQEGDENSSNVRDKHKTKKSKEKLATFGSHKNSVLKELLQMKQENNKLFKPQAQDSNSLVEKEGVQPSGNTFKNRKLSADNYNTERNKLKDSKQTNRSRKSNSSKPTNRLSRADSRNTSTRSNKEDSKSATNPDQPANNQISQENDNKQYGINEDVNIVTKFAFATRVGYIPNNPYKVNQDSYLLAPNIMKLPAFHYFGVCDGHGQNGKEVSEYVKQRLPVLIESYIKSHGNEKEALTEAFVTVNTELDYVPFDCQFSGTTCCTVLFKGNRLISANSGDSRAIVVRNSPTQSTKGVTSIQVEQLTRDHKPDEQDEYARIIAEGGRIEAFKDLNGEPMGPVRVWIQNEDVPGLAMSRSLGDKVAQSVGVIPNPEILDYTLTPNDQFILIASDGVWEFMSNVDVARLVYPYIDKNAPEAAANMLVKEATKRWKKEEEVIDDIT